MSKTSIYCRLIGREVVRLTGVGGRFADVICPEWDETTGICKLKAEAIEGGHLSYLLQAVGETSTTVRCGLG